MPIRDKKEQTEKSRLMQHAHPAVFYLSIRVRSMDLEGDLIGWVIEQNCSMQ
jgi:hypothetical protein